ncbi:MAG: DUF4250 domain-containing protein [Candidatus Coproplasma sp.]
MQLPQDNLILLSFINTKLRDECPSLDDFCAEYDLSPQDICARMAETGYYFDEEENAFKRG